MNQPMLKELHKFVVFVFVTEPKKHFSFHLPAHMLAL